MRTPVTRWREIFELFGRVEHIAVSTIAPAQLRQLSALRNALSSPRLADKFAQRIPPRNRTHRIITRLVLINALGVKRK